MYDQANVSFAKRLVPHHVLFVHSKNLNIVINKNDQVPYIFFSTQFMPVVFFYTSWIYQKTYGSLMFLGGIKNDQWYKMG